MDDLTFEATKGLLLAAADRIIASKDILTEVDSKIGDGDHGIGMHNGMVKARQAPGTRGILVCGTGIGMCICANKFKGITESARFAADICALLRPEDLSSVTAFIIPSYLAIPGVRDAIGPEGPLMFGAQNVCAQEQVAYEPVWAIGTAGVPASPEYAQEKHAVIRSALTRVLGPAGGQIPLLYGGSVNPDNADALIRQPDIDGLFVGRAAWTAQGFVSLLRQARRSAGLS